MENLLLRSRYFTFIFIDLGLFIFRLLNILKSLFEVFNWRGFSCLMSEIINLRLFWYSSCYGEHIICWSSSFSMRSKSWLSKLKLNSFLFIQFLLLIVESLKLSVSLRQELRTSILCIYFSASFFPVNIS